MLPAYERRTKILRYLQNITTRSDVLLSYTAISTRICLEALLGGPAPFINVAKRQVTIYDGGHVPVSVTPVSLVGKAVVAVLQNPQVTINKIVLVHGGAFTQNQILALIQRHVGQQGWSIEEADTGEMERGSWCILDKDSQNLMGWLPGFVRRGMFGKGYGGDFTG